MTIFQRLWRLLWKPIPLTIIAILAGLIALLRYYPNWFYASLPELIGTFVGAVLGFVFGMIIERKSNEEEKKEIEEYEEQRRIQDVKYIYEAITYEEKENLKILEILKGQDVVKIPERFLRVSSWYAVQDYIRALADRILIEKLHELYNNIELLNTDIHYFRQSIFLSDAPTLDITVSSKNRRFLAFEIRRITYIIIEQYREIEKFFIIS